MGGRGQSMGGSKEGAVSTSKRTGGASDKGAEVKSISSVKKGNEYYVERYGAGGKIISEKATAYSVGSGKTGKYAWFRTESGANEEWGTLKSVHEVKAPTGERLRLTHNLGGYQGNVTIKPKVVDSVPTRGQWSAIGTYNGYTIYGKKSFYFDAEKNYVAVKRKK